ncbi:hypothetical protein CK203_019083 [Vitis vinifera]|uniref:DUF4283 domain-containing protein n=1 Tax=Vitis vinifera TaxID=29760 RepID=A0A438IQZ1_VITVI|nr:hypothetical protein CK203_019083 [Vitis vinifera]
MRGGKRWFAIESKSFEVSVEEVRGKIRGTIVERSRGLSSWIRFGVTSLRNFLEGLEECCREERYILCSVIDVESKRFCLVVPEGKGLPGGWALFAEKLWDLGVVMQEEKEVGEKKLFVDVTKKPVGKQGDALWLQVGGRGLRNREKGLGKCLVGSWGTGSVGEPE